MSFDFNLFRFFNNFMSSNTGSGIGSSSGNTFLGSSTGNHFFGS